MNLYEATMKAADHIEDNPELFLYENVLIPDCGTPGCAIGHIGYFMGYRVGMIIWCEGATNIIGVHSVEWTRRMDEISPANWRIDARKCAQGLRLYAEKYLKEQKPKVETGISFNVLMEQLKSGTLEAVA